MPEANVLYGVTGVVVAGLVVWVAAVLKTAKQPWARPEAAAAAVAARAPDVPVEKTEDEAAPEAEAKAEEPEAEPPASDEDAEGKA